MTDADLALQADEDLRSVLSTPSGRRFMWSLIDGRAGVHGASFAGEQTHEAAYAEGKRAVGVLLLQDCRRVASSEYLHMLAEAVSRQQDADLERAAAEREHEDAGSDG